jgi:prepilin-type processing-associated H-X9-DG protein
MGIRIPIRTSSPSRRKTTMKLSPVHLSRSARFGLVALGVTVAAGAFLYGRATESARRRECERNLRLIGLALRDYVRHADAFPPGTPPNAALPPERRLGLFVPFLLWAEQIFLDLEPAEPWDSPTNRATRAHGTDGLSFPVGRVPTLVCPAAPGARAEHQPGWTWYVGVAGVGPDAPTLPLGHPRSGLFGYDRQTPPGAIRDGAANTLALVETGEANGPWTAGGPATLRAVDPARRPHLGRGRPFGGLHPGGAMVAMADGSVRFVRESIDPAVFEALATVAGGEVLPAGWDR